VESYLKFIGMMRGVAKSGFFPAIMENQFLGKGSKMNPKSFASLVRGRSRMELALEMCGVEVQMTAPASWQSRTLRCPRNMKSEGRKWAAKNLTQQLTGHQGKLSFDEADSFCMALYGRHHQTL